MGLRLSDAQNNQIEHELGIIDALGFSGFFLVMWDAVRFARARKFSVRAEAALRIPRSLTVWP